MSHTLSPAPSTRAVKTILKGAGARLAGKQRGGDKVHRSSYDVRDSKAQVFRRIEDGSRAAGMGWIDDIVETAEQYDLTHRKPGQRGPLQATGVRVLKVMLRKFLRFGSGQLDPAIRAIADATGYTYKTVHAALKRLAAHGFLRWVRRSRAIEDASGPGPRREQVSNAYEVTPGQLGKRALMFWRGLREARRRRLAASPSGPRPPLPAKVPSDPALAAVLARVEVAITKRESQHG